MERFLLAVVAGVAGSATIALLATALLVRLRTSKVVDLGLGAVAMYVAYVFFEFRASGDLILPILGLPARLHLVDRPTVATALVVLVVFAALLGAGLHVLFYERLRDLPPLASLAATLGILLYFQQMVQLRFPSSSAGVRSRTPVLPQGRVSIGALRLSGDRLVLLLVALAVATVMYLLFGRTRFGRLSDAATSSSLGAMCVGIVPARIAAVGAALATAVASVALVLAEPIAGLGPTTALLVIPAVAAVLLGGLRQFGAAAAGALGIGAVQAVILATAVGPARTWFPSWLSIGGVQAFVPTVVIVVLLYRRGEMLAKRGSETSVEHPVSLPSRHVPLGVAAILSVTAMVLVLGGPAQRQALTVSAIAAVLYLSIVVVTGYNGQLSLLPVTTAGITGLVCLGLVRSGFPFLVAVAAALGCAAMIGWATGRSVVKLRGMSVALVTLALAMSLEALLLNSDLLGGTGDPASRPAKVLGLDVGFAGTGNPGYGARFVILVTGILVLACVLTAALRSGTLGLRMLAAKSNEQRAAVIGVDVPRARIRAFVLGSVLAGVSGILTVFSVQRPSAMSFMVVGSIVAVALTTMAGAGGISGAVLAAVIAPGGLVMALLSGSGSGAAATYVSALSGISLALTVGMLPDGVIGALLERRSARSTDERSSSIGSEQPAPTVVEARSVEGRSLDDRSVECAALTITDLSVEREGNRILDGVSLTVHRGEVVGLMGLNGAGKTTLFDACSGLVRVCEGDIRIEDRSIVELPVHQRVGAGLGRTFQSDELFGQLTIEENLQLAGAPSGQRAGASARRAADLAGGCAPRGRANQLDKAEALALSIEMAVASGPKVLLLDEPASGLDNQAKQLLASLIGRLARSGIGILICDHDRDFVELVSERIVVLADTRISGGPVELEQSKTEFLDVPIESHCLDNGSARAEDGQLVVLSGDDAEVQTALEALVGLKSRRARAFYPSPGGRSRTRLPRLARHGLSYVPGSRGLFNPLTVRQNLVLGNGNRPLVSEDIAWLSGGFPELVDLLDRSAGVLSGGEQQLLALARALISKPRTLVVDRPFHGLSPTATRRILGELCEVAATGTAVVLARIEENHMGTLPASMRRMDLRSASSDADDPKDCLPAVPVR